MVGVFPGSFDPITLGHTDIVDRAIPLFETIYIGIGNNSAKNYLFSLEKRLEFINNIYQDNGKIRVESYEGLTSEFCKKVNADVIIRGLRSVGDFEFEQPVAQMNKQQGEIETIFLMCSPQYSSISSSIIRELIRYGSDVSKFVPPGVG